MKCTPRALSRGQKAVGVGQNTLGVWYAEGCPRRSLLGKDLPRRSTLKPSAYQNAVGVCYAEGFAVGVAAVGIACRPVAKTFIFEKKYFFYFFLNFFILWIVSLVNLLLWTFLTLIILTIWLNSSLSQTSQQVTHPNTTPASARLTSSFLQNPFPQSNSYIGVNTMISILLTLISSCHMFVFFEITNNYLSKY